MCLRDGPILWASVFEHFVVRGGNNGRHEKLKRMCAPMYVRISTWT
jgi:hypothetical protein